MVKDIKELEKLLKLCRKQGVTEITIQDVSFKLGELPVKTHHDEQERTETIEDSDDPYAGFPPGNLTPTQLMFYSAGGTPDEDPELNQ